MNIKIPELCLVALVGPSGSGKSSFAAKHFLPTEVLSSDWCRGLVADDENDQGATKEAFDVLHYIARTRLLGGRLTVVDATNVQMEARKPLVQLARECHVLPVAIVLNMPEELCQERNKNRPDRDFGPHVVRRQRQQLRRSLRALKKEGFRHIHVFDTPEELDAAVIERQPLWNNLRHETGPFDIVGDVHGCRDELVDLLGTLGWAVGGTREAPDITHPEGRRAIFLGDLVDRGPDSPGVLRIAMSMVAAGTALCIPGNHENKLMRALKGRNVTQTHGLAETLEQMEREPEGFGDEVARFIDRLVSHYVLDHGELVVAHAGLKEAFQGRASGAVRNFALYGETTGETDEYGLPVRYNWAGDYRGKAMVVYGHTPVPEAEWLNRTICIDTGCVFGGKLTALRYPERDLVDVPARQEYYESVKPLRPAGPGGEDRPGDLLDIEDVAGKRIIRTALHGNVTVRAENGAAALEVMSRFAADPRWLIYLPPTMSPTATADEGPWLEYPREAFSYFRKAGVASVICEEKHMGSRAVITLCRDGEVARKRFGETGDRRGLIHTRTGRHFFPDAAMETAVLDRIAAAMDGAGLWDRFETGWIALDAEIMPWSAKAEGLLRLQYAAVGAAGQASMGTAVDALKSAAALGMDGTVEMLNRYEGRKDMLDAYVEAYRRYCWPVGGIDDLKIAPFHLLATEGVVHSDKNHQWHMDTLAELAAQDPKLIMATAHRIVDLSDEASEAEATRWWEEMTGTGGEGMVVKPLDWIQRDGRGLVQPAVKCRGREYLRIIYGPEYTAPADLERLRRRGLSHKRSMALREFALGMEALQRFASGEPLYRVHECVFAVLALESEPVDPRL
ncbi:MAG: polynucleotide kinase-phosphatase [Proteobacteria bacterium]|nr:polynucleotide kinase-phosphatase [Pseudomonadota bacterium]